MTISSHFVSDHAAPPLAPPLLRAPHRPPASALPAVLGSLGTLELRVAASREEVRLIQQLRYAVFYENGTAAPDRHKVRTRRDTCPFDETCDHLYVVDTGSSESQVVGTYRLLRDDVAAAQDGFYSETEFRLGPVLARHRDTRILELGRSCVHPRFRSRRVIDLLWLGVSRYAVHYGCEVLIGCASVPGTQAAELALPLSFALHHAAAPEAWQVSPHPRRAMRMDWLDRDSFDARSAFLSLPPLMKAYVRAGATFASQAAVDHAFGTTDLFTVLPLNDTAPRYLARFGLDAAGVA